tara:strand:- start:145 stop:1245 length:1101 start_codon:yes stop_codon:yes gene_type:complete
MTKARLLAQLGNAYDDGALSNRNMIINGAMKVAQRGTSTTGVNSSGYHTVDRFSYTEGSGASGTVTMSQEDDAPEGFAKSVKFEVTGASTLSGSENVLLRTRLEGQDLQQLKYGTSNAQAITLSFWAKSSLTGTYTSAFTSRNTTDGSTLRYYKGYTINVANTWEYKTLTIPAQTTNTIDSDNSQGVDLEWMLDSGPDDIVSPSTAWDNSGIFAAVTGQVNFMATSGATWQITGVQLEVGDTATPFEHRSYADELTKCQRYLYRINGNSTDQTMIGMGYFYGTTTTRHIVHYPVVMRSSPSVSANGLDALRDTGNDSAVTLASTLDESIYSCGLNIGDVLATSVGEGAILRLASLTSAYISFDAEL